MNTDQNPNPVEDWIDAFARPLEILTTIAIVAGVIGIVLSLFLLIASSPKGPRR